MRRVKRGLSILLGARDGDFCRGKRANGKEAVIMWIWIVLAAILVLVGIAGTILPALPGLPLVFAGLLLAAWADGFAHVSGVTMLLLALITVVAMAADFVSGLFGTKIAGASKWAMVGAGAGTLVGLFFGLPGLLLGPFIGAMALELVYRENLGQATKAGLGAWLGMVLGVAAKMAALCTMLAVFASAWWFF
jgi:uncharacterized protein